MLNRDNCELSIIHDFGTNEAYDFVYLEGMMHISVLDTDCSIEKTLHILHNAVVI